MNSLGVGIVGTGFGQLIHIPGWQACTGTKVLGLYHYDLKKAQQIAQKFNIPFACDRLEDLYANPDIHIISISTPPFLHYEAAKLALEAGKHILLEKPVTLNVSEAIALQQLVESRGLTVGVDFEFRFVPSWRYLKYLLEQEHIGKIRSIYVEWQVSGRADANRQWNWYSQKSQGGGALGALGSHTFDYVRWLFGEVKGLTAQLKTTIPERPDRNGTMQLVDADDTCNILLELSDGVPVNIAISTVAYAGSGHWLTIYGDRGTLVLGSKNLKDYVHGFNLYYAPPHQELEIIPIPSEYELPEVYKDGRLAPFIALGDRFVKAINEGTSFTPSLGEGIQSQLLMDLAHQSDQIRRWIYV
ncbi:putative dehydrogenase [Synechococcus sp. PCC 7502]|uniref:Gfo/Idh/MocA family protein n=1 Tax=Synechococcus sp. PCC 7502 TaxID=1173263 RepID=UPI00029FE335|nr:Gfo/Idh/MocA family oxidoreductase [Synechococcus sp. PCC 7502]AFY74555.1 putative dehydrogenase [Synechococcus sp. PCC 7502]